MVAITSASLSRSTSASTSTAITFAAEVAVTALATFGRSVTLGPDARRKLRRPLTRPTERLP